jgi:hypothetical protein
MEGAGIQTYTCPFVMFSLYYPGTYFYIILTFCAYATGYKTSPLDVEMPSRRGRRAAAGEFL